MIAQAIRATFEGLVEANKIERKPAPLSKLTVGLEMRRLRWLLRHLRQPRLGHVSDMLAVLGGTSPCSPNFPSSAASSRASSIAASMTSRPTASSSSCAATQARAKAVHSGFEMNPSPGNIRDGLLTDAMKSAGAARKGGTSPVTDVLDYPEYVRKPGLTLQCTPGNDVECVTGQVGAGANVVLFTTGLGTPTGNPIAPVIKLATNTRLAQRMSDIIDIDTGPIIEGASSIHVMADQILELIIAVASGKTHTKAEGLRQDDFIPWKRGVSL